MEKENKNEGLQSRRDFFKKAAKNALPILGAIALIGTPKIVKAEEVMGCDWVVCPVVEALVLAVVKEDAVELALILARTLVKALVKDVAVMVAPALVAISHLF